MTKTVPKMKRCFKCNYPIQFKRVNGKWIAVTPYTEDRHVCVPTVETAYRSDGRAFRGVTMPDGTYHDID